MAYDYDSDARKKQEEDKRKSRRVYSTALIDELVKERNMGYDIPYDAFFMRDLDLRAPNVTFKMTDEEMEEYQRCYDDAEYYVENYILVELEALLHLLIILMSRQLKLLRMLIQKLCLQMMVE